MFVCYPMRSNPRLRALTVFFDVLAAVYVMSNVVSFVNYGLLLPLSWFIVVVPSIASLLWVQSIMFTSGSNQFIERFFFLTKKLAFEPSDLIVGKEKRFERVVINTAGKTIKSGFFQKTGEFKVVSAIAKLSSLVGESNAELQP